MSREIGGGMRRFAVLLVLIAPVVLAGCDWNQFLYDTGHSGFNSSESTISTDNVSTLVEKFTAHTGGLLTGSAPVVSHGVAYVVSGDGNLYAFSASGNASCSGSPKTCTPLWTAAAGGGATIMSSPAVSGGVIYAAGDDGVVRAFDAGGKSGCAGTPTVCTPLWTANVSVDASVAPVVANGTLFVSSTTMGLVAFDAAGQIGCSGTPEVCSPLWDTSFGGFVSVSNETVYVAGSDVIEAYDATGTNNCSGSSPKTCSPLLQYEPNYPLTQVVTDYAVISGTTLYTQAATPFGQLPAHENVEAFDAQGVTGCTPAGTLKVCTPTWTTADVTGAFPPASVANGSLYVNGSNGLSVFDASGTVGCTGSPKICSSLWTSASTETADAPMSVANGVLFGADDKNLYALDASGHTNCSGSVCSPLWTATPTTSSTFIYSGPIVANGFVYATVGNDLVAYGLAS